MARKQKMTKRERENIAFLLKLLSCCFFVVGFLCACFVVARLFGGGIDDVSTILPAISVLLCITGFFIAMIDRLEFKTNTTVFIIASLVATLLCASVFAATLVVTHNRDRRFVPKSTNLTDIQKNSLD